MTPMQKAGYLAHARTRGYRQRLLRALSMIAEHPDYCVSISWGKDSLCILHMALEVHGHATAVHARYSENEELPDMPNVRQEFLERFQGVDYYEFQALGDWELYDYAGRFFLAPETADEKWFLKHRKEKRNQDADRLMLDLGCAGKVLGLAAHESRGRAMNVYRRGEHYQTQAEAIPKLLPIAHWKPEDVWAYMLTHDLPRLKIYDFAEDPERARSEVAFAAIGAEASDAIRRHGAWRLWADCYPDLWKKWTDKYPEISSLC